MLSRKPVFSLGAVLSRALGIGLNTAIFTLINAMVPDSLPYRESNRLVAVFSVSPEQREQLNGASIPDLRAWRERSRSFTAIGGLFANAIDFGAGENGMPAERIQGENVTPALLQALGVQPPMGRLFTGEDDEVDHPAPALIITHRL